MWRWSIYWHRRSGWGTDQPWHTQIPCTCLFLNKHPTQIQIQATELIGSQIFLPISRCDYLSLIQEAKIWQKLYIPAWPLDVPFTPLLPYWPLFSSEGLPIPSSFPFQATPAFLMSCQEPNSFFSQLAKVRWTKFISAVGKCKRLHWKSHQSWNWSPECN